MRTVVELHGSRTTVEDGRVSGPDPVVRAIIRMILMDHAGEYIPDREHQAASEFVSRHGGAIVEYDGPGTEGNLPGTVY